MMQAKWARPSRRLRSPTRSTEHEIPATKSSRRSTKALREMAERGITGKETTPFSSPR